MKTIYKSQLPKPEEEVRADLTAWLAAKEAHKQTVGVPAPLPEYELLYLLEENFIVLEDEDEKEPETFEELKQLKRKKVNDRRKELEREGFEYLGKIFDSDEQSFFRILSANDSALKSAEDFSLVWTTQDNSEIELNKAQILGMLPALTAYGSIIFQKAKLIKAAIEACQTEAELDAIDTEFSATED